MNEKAKKIEAVTELPTMAVVCRKVINLAHTQLAERLYLGALPYICMDLYNHDIVLVATLIISGQDVRFSFLLDNETRYEHFYLSKNLQLVIRPIKQIGGDVAIK